MRVILLEDDSVLANVLADFLQEDGHMVSQTVDMHQAHCLASSGQWDACLLDPPGSSFVELSTAGAAQLRRLAAQVPVVVITARAWAQRTTPTSLGVRAILPKPFIWPNWRRSSSRPRNARFHHG